MDTIGELEETMSEVAELAIDDVNEAISLTLAPLRSCP